MMKTKKLLQPRLYKFNSHKQTERRTHVHMNIETNEQKFVFCASKEKKNKKTCVVKSGKNEIFKTELSLKN